MLAAARSGLTVKAVGAGHSFSGIARAEGLRIDLDGLTGLIAVDAVRRQATFAAGTRLSAVPDLLAPHDLAMANLGDIDRQSIAGAISTGTHGTGLRFGGLATQVAGATLVLADGSMLTVSETENADLLPAVALGLGALGVLVDVTLRCVPAFLLRAVEEAEPLSNVVNSLRERAAAVDHFEFYWFPHTDLALTKSNTRVPEPGEPRPISSFRAFVDDELIGNRLFALTCALGVVAPGIVPPLNRLAARTVPRRQYTDRSASVFTAHRAVRFVEQEYAMPLDRVPEALDQINRFIERRRLTVSFPLEVRVAAADDLWLSTSFGQETGYIATHRYYRENPAEYFAGVEDICRAVGGRPHWGKLHQHHADSLRWLYPRFDDFLAVRERLDPARLFANAYLSQVLGD